MNTSKKLQVRRTTVSLQNKWKNIKQQARRRNKLVKDSQNQTGGGVLTKAQKRVVESQLYSDVATKLGISASGNPARFDSDQVEDIPEPPSKRVARSLSLANPLAFAFDEDSQMSIVSLDSNVDSEANLTAISTSTSTSTQSHSNVSIGDKAGTSGLQTKAKKTASKTSSAKPSQNVRDMQMSNATMLNEHLLQQNQSGTLYHQFLELQIQRGQLALEREKMQLKQAEIEVKKSEELAKIEVEKQREIAKIAIEAERKQKGL